MGEPGHIRAQHAEVKEKIRKLKQDVSRLLVRQHFFLLRLPLLESYLFWPHVLRTTRS